MVNHHLGYKYRMPYANLLQKHVSQKVFFKKKIIKKKNSRQYLLSVAFYERSLLILKDIFFFQINPLKAYI